MKPTNDLNVCKIAACLAVAVLFLLSVAPVEATESDVKEKGLAPAAKPANAATPGSEERPNTGICIDADNGESVGVNTLEDIFALSAGSLAALMEQASVKPAEAGPATEEVRWQAVESGTKDAAQERESQKD